MNHKAEAEGWVESSTQATVDSGIREGLSARVTFKRGPESNKPGK